MERAVEEVSVSCQLAVVSWQRGRDFFGRVRLRPSNRRPKFDVLSFGRRKCQLVVSGQLSVASRSEISLVGWGSVRTATGVLNSKSAVSAGGSAS
jgi:hypothetical protein